MQIRFNQDVYLQNEEGGITTITKGTVISDVEAVHAVPKDVNLRSIQIAQEPTKDASGALVGVTYQYLLLPVEVFGIEEAPGWQAYARREEDRIHARKMAAQVGRAA